MHEAWIDAHIHLFEHGHRRDRPAGAELTDYTHWRSVHGISHALVVGFEGDPALAGNNLHLARIAEDHDWILPLRYVHPAQGLAPADELAGASWRGISLYLLDPESQAAWSSWTGQDWSTVPADSLVSINTTQDGLAAVADVAERIEHTVLISHLATPPAPRTDVTTALAAVTALATNPRIHVKLSGHWAMTLAGWSTEQLAESTQVLVEAFGPERVHWGSDFSPCLEHHDFATAAHPAGLGELPPSVVQRIRGAGLADLLNLP